MEFKTYNDVLDLHTRFTDAFQKRLETLRKELPKSAEELIASKKAAIKQAQAAAADADRARKDAMKRYDAAVSDSRAQVERLTRELDELEGGIKGVKSRPAPGKKSPK